MVIYKLAKETDRPFKHITASEQEFVNEYQCCFYDPTRKTNTLFKMIEPSLKYFSKALREKDFSDITLSSLLNFFEDEPFSGFEKIQKWVTEVEKQEGLENRLAFLFFQRLRLFKHVLLFSHKPRHQEYIICFYFKRDLFVDIRKNIKTFEEYIEPYENPSLPDYLALKNLSQEDKLLISNLNLYGNILSLQKQTKLKQSYLTNRINNIWNQLFSKEEKY